MSPLKTFANWADSFPTQPYTMPVLFVGHGSPMNAITQNEFSRTWATLGTTLPTPKAIVCISAHWLTQGTYVTATVQPRTIHDFGGFPPALHAVEYPAQGSPALAQTIQQTVQQTHVGLDDSWGLDHGTWSILKHIYPLANIPVVQLSIDYHKPAAYHYELAKELSFLRKKGVLIIGSGNMVHHLGKIAWDKINEPNYGYDWAIEINEIFKQLLITGNHQALIAYEKLGKAALLAVPTPDHYYPMLYSLGLQTPQDELQLFNDQYVGGSLTMTSVQLKSIN